jgi:hypothetical protein
VGRRAIPTTKAVARARQSFPSLHPTRRRCRRTRHSPRVV